MKNFKSLVLLSGCLLVAVAFVACGGGKKSKSGDPTGVAGGAGGVSAEVRGTTVSLYGSQAILNSIGQNFCAILQTNATTHTDCAPIWNVIPGQNVQTIVQNDISLWFPTRNLNEVPDTIILNQSDPQTGQMINGGQTLIIPKSRVILFW